MTKKTEQTKTVQLTVEELQNLGCRLSNILKTIKMDQVAQAGVSLAKDRDSFTFTHLATNYLSSSYEVFETIIAELDDIASQLLECDDAEELEGFRMADKFEPSNNIVNFSEHMQELEDQEISLTNFQNDGSFNSMVCEFAIGMSNHIDRLIGYLEEQQKTIRSMTKEIENLKRKK